MFSSLLSAACVALITLPGHAAPFDVALRLSTSEVSARNASAGPQVLVFHSDGQRVLHLLPAGAEVTWSFPRHAFAGVDVALLARADGGWRLGEVHALEELVARGVESLYLAALGEDSGANADGTTFGLPGEDTGAFGPMHVPVITPSDTPPADLPPKIEKEPLPPV